MSAVLEAKTAMRQLATKAQEVVTDASLTQAEKQESLDRIEADIKSHAATISMHEQAQRLVAGGEAAPEEKSDAEVRAKSFAEQVIDSDAYRNVVGKQTQSAAVDVETVNTIDEGIIPAFSGGAGQGGPLVAPQLLPGIVPLLFQPLTVADLMPSGPTSSSSISYVIESAFQDTSAAVLEQGTKPQLGLPLARRQA